VPKLEFVNIVRDYSDPRVFARGQGYFREGRVRITFHEQDHVEAEVDGSRTYACGFWFEEGVAGAMCDCPYTEANGDICKHLVALALTMESSGIAVSENINEISVSAFPQMPKVPKNKPRSLPRGAESKTPRIQNGGSNWDEEESEDEVDFDPFEDADENEDDDFEFDPMIVGYPRADEKKHDKKDQSAGDPPAGKVLQLPSRSSTAPNDWWTQWTDAATAAANTKHDEGSTSHGFLVEVPGFDTKPWSTEAPRIRVIRAIRKRRQNGSLGVPKRPTRRASLEPGPGYERVRSILRWIAGAPKSEYEFGFVHDPLDSHVANEEFELPPESAAELLARICATGAAYLSIGFRALSDMPLEFDAGPPFRLRIEMKRGEDGGGVVRASLDREAESITLGVGVRFAAGGLALIGQRWIRVEPRGFERVLQNFVERAPKSDVERSIPARAVRPFLEAMHRLPRRPTLDVDASFAPSELVGTLEPILRVDLQPPQAVRGRPKTAPTPAPEPIRGVVVMKYGAREFTPSDPTESWLDSEAWRVERRDVERERASVAALAALDLGFDATRGVMEIPLDRFSDTVRRATEAGFIVVANDRRLVSSQGIKARVESSGVDWFDLTLDAGFGESSPPLPELLAAVSRGERIVRLSDGAFGVLPEAWLNSRRALLKVGEAKDDVIRFHRAQAMLLHALANAPGDGVVVETDATFERAREALLRGDRPVAEDAPKGFTGALRPYQREGLGWMNHLLRVGIGGCLADDMGLGKTVQVLALIAGLLKIGRRAKPASGQSLPRVLVVAPRSLVFNWIAEAQRFVPDLPTLAYVGTDREEKLSDFGGGLVVTTYGTLRSDAQLPQIRFSLVVLDEAQAIKNRDTATALAARALVCDRRLALSGTPVENHAGELISLFEFLVPGLLGTHAGARRKELTNGSSPDLLFSALRPLVLRRTKEQVAPDLPPRTEQTIYCELEGAQRKRYDELRDHYRAHLLSKIESSGLNERNRFQVLEALLRLRQAACHPALIDPRLAKESCAKLDVLLPRLADVLAEGHKALVFSQFTSFLALVRERLDAAGIRYEYLDGKTRDRAAVVRRFQEKGDVGVFLISLRAGGLGLNLTVADYVFLLDPWWNPAVEAQAIDRTHRIGQQRPVFAYRLLAKDTVEERVAELQAHKRELFDSLMAETATLRNLDVEDLNRLLS
jgi:superfamily II DNA or RNA helicase